MQQHHCCIAVSIDRICGIPAPSKRQKKTDGGLIKVSAVTFTSREPRRRNGFFRPLVELTAGIRLARAMAHRYDVLSRLSDGELAAHGIARQDIPRLVVN